MDFGFYKWLQRRFQCLDHNFDSVLAKLDAIDFRVTNLGVKIMETLESIQGNEDHEGTALGQLADAVTALKGNIADLTTQLQAVLAGTTLPPAVQTKVDALFAKSKANSDEVDAILTSLAPVPPVPDNAP